MSDLKTKLIMAVSAHDRRAAKRRGYNPYALGHYFRAVDDVMDMIEQGHTPRDAIESVMNDRLREACLKVVKDTQAAP